ncbi:MAG: YdbL family protein [Nitrospirales bacterium]
MPNKIRITQLLIGCLLVGFLALPSWGVTLDEAKQKGMLGERPDGYLGVVTPSTDTAVIDLMKEINQKRQEVYQTIADKNGTALSTVEALAGEKALKQTPPGQYILLPSGEWSIKP